MFCSMCGCRVDGEIVDRTIVKTGVKTSEKNINALHIMVCDECGQKLRKHFKNQTI